VASNSGHWIPLEEPQIVIDAIAEALTQVRQSA